ncbi:ATP-grasp fold amidoligase family protein [Vibrio harveyi]
MPSLSYKIFSRFLSFTPLSFNIKVLYLRRFGRLPDIENPSSFNEKLQYRKLYDRNELLPILADKIESKKYVAKIVPSVYIPEIIWSGDDFHSIDFSELPSDYVIKANHASQTNYFVRDEQHLSLERLEKLRAEWFSHDQAAVLGEWAYSKIKKKVFIEEFLDFGGTVPDDYKLFVFNGKVKAIQLDTGRFSKHYRSMFNEKWEELPFDYSYSRINPTPKEPPFLKEMIEVAELIGASTDFCRVDLYFHDEKITFGEVTIYPGAGFEKFPDSKWDAFFGDLWELKY